MKTILITGNGFNYMINEWINNLTNDKISELNLGSKDEIKQEIKEITILWQKFNDIFTEIKKNLPQLSEEELIRLIYSVIELFSNLPGLEKIFNPEKIEDLKNLFDSFLLDKIREIAEEFRNHHESTGYKNLKKIFPSFGKKFNDLIDLKNTEFFNIFTTNYDGLLDTLLTGDPRGFIFHDGFSHFNENLLTISEENINFDKLICHIHGSYLYKREFGYTYKLKNNLINSEPIMVFNNPDFKEQIINRDNVLARYYHILLESLKVADNLIILGNSMKNEPHLKKIISKYANRPNLNLYVCSTNPQKIADELTKHYSHKINLVDTKAFINEDEFLSFIERVI